MPDTIFSAHFNHVGHYLPPGTRNVNPNTPRRLPRALELAIQHHLMIRPIVARSRSISANLLSCDRQLLDYWHRHLPGAQWVLDAEASEIVVVEFEQQLARHSAHLLKAHIEALQKTLHFRVRNHLVALFRNRADSAHTVHASGVRVRSGKAPVLIPPSRISSGEILFYANEDAPLLDINLLATHR